MRTRAKRLPRLWCALQGLLPLEDCLAAQRAELAWPPEPVAEAIPGPGSGDPAKVTEKKLAARPRRAA